MCVCKCYPRTVYVSIVGLVVCIYGSAYYFVHGVAHDEPYTFAIKAAHGV